MDGRDPKWPYYTEPAIWSKAGTSLRAITTIGPTEWQLSDLIDLASKASGSFSEEPAEPLLKESAVMSQLCNWLLITGDTDTLIDLNARAFDNRIYITCSSEYAIDSFRISHTHLFRARGRLVTHVELQFGIYIGMHRKYALSNTLQAVPLEENRVVRQIAVRQIWF
jgi:hypothetical protein